MKTKSLRVATDPHSMLRAVAGRTERTRRCKASPLRWPWRPGARTLERPRKRTNRTARPTGQRKETKVARAGTAMSWLSHTNRRGTKLRLDQDPMADTRSGSNSSTRTRAVRWKSDDSRRTRQQERTGVWGWFGRTKTRGLGSSQALVHTRGTVQTGLGFKTS